MNFNDKLRTAQRNIKSNTQRAALALLKAKGTWVPRSKIKVASATSRIRDLRKKQYGSFKVECKSASELKRRTTGNMFYYRIEPDTVTEKQLDTVFS